MLLQGLVAELRLSDGGGGGEVERGGGFIFGGGPVGLQGREGVGDGGGGKRGAGGKGRLWEESWREVAGRLQEKQQKKKRSLV